MTTREFTKLFNNPVVRRRLMRVDVTHEIIEIETAPNSDAFTYFKRKRTAAAGVR